jgi:hypothetical protein
MKKEDYVTLKPGQTLAWQPKWISVQNGGYELTYCFAGSQFGLHAWRGKLMSNLIRCKIDASN